jgi:hypothetical protein
MPLILCTCISIGVPEGVTLLDSKTGLLEEHQQVWEPEGQPQEVEGEGGIDPEELLECPDHQPSSFLKGKPQSIISLPCFAKP